MGLSRRQFLRYTALSGVAVSTGGLPLLGQGRLPQPHAGTPAPGHPAGSGTPLRLPAEFSGTTIVASEQPQQVWAGAPTQVWTYGGGYPAPTIRAKSGTTFAVSLHNQLPEPTNIHWHGFLLPAAMDGYPSDVAGPGEVFDYSFTVNQRAGTYWYHPHPDMRTGPQVYKGMAGFFIVENDAELALGLPAGQYDVPLMIQDRRIDASNAFTYELTDDDHLEGYLGDVLLVNGTPDAYLKVEAGLYRLRVLNGSNARILDLALSDGSTMVVIGTDGGLLDRPYEVKYAYLAPAERLDLLIDFSRYHIGDSVTLKTLDFSGGSGRQQGVAMNALRFDITRSAATQYQIPATLVPYEKLDPATASRTRTFTMTIDHTTTPAGHPINGKTFDMTRIDENVVAGDVEVWAFENISFLNHPMHIHGVQFQVVSRSSMSQLPPRDLGWKDTVYVRPFETVKVVVRFPEFTGTYLVHCHNLEHEDHGMMLNFNIAAKDSAVEQSADVPPERLDLH